MAISYRVTGDIVAVTHTCNCEYCEMNGEKRSIGINEIVKVRDDALDMFVTPSEVAHYFGDIVLGMSKYRKMQASWVGTVEVKELGQVALSLDKEKQRLEKWNNGEGLPLDLVNL